MNRSTKIFAIVMVTVLLLSVLGGCTSAQTKAERRPIGVCAGYDVLYEELRYVTLSYKDIMASAYGETIWDTPESAEAYREELEETVWRMMLNNYAVLAACRDYISEEDMESDLFDDAVDAVIDEAIEAYGGEKAFREEMKNLYMTEHLVRFCQYVAKLEYELLCILADDLNVIENDKDDFIEWVRDGNGVYVQHIFIENDEGEDVEQNRAKAEQVREQLMSGTDIATLIGTAVNEDLKNVQPYYIIRDVYVQEMEDAAFAMQSVGDASAVVETADGFYVMQRLADTNDSLTAKAAELLYSYQMAVLEAFIDTYKEDLSIELNEYGKSIDLLAIT